MQITLDTSNPHDVDILVGLAAMLSGETTSVVPPAEQQPVKAATAKKAAAPKVTVEPEPDADSGGATMEAAVARATELVSAGKARVVKDALNTCSATRVSELSDDQLGDFLDLLTEIGVKQIEAKLDAES